jgi:hypothetical protein
MLKMKPTTKNAAKLKKAAPVAARVVVVPKGQVVVFLPIKEWGFGKEERDVTKVREDITFRRHEVRAKYLCLGVLSWTGNLLPGKTFGW